MDQEQLRKRMSQIELEIQEMNSVIDENLQLDDGNGKLPDDDASLDEEMDARKVLREKFLANCERSVEGGENGREGGTVAGSVPGARDGVETDKTIESVEDATDAHPMESTLRAHASEDSAQAVEEVRTTQPVEEARNTHPVETATHSQPVETTTNPHPVETATHSHPIKDTSAEHSTQLDSSSHSPSFSPPHSPTLPQPLPRPSHTRTSAHPHTLRKTSNPSPFRVVSVSKNPDHSQAQKLQARHDYLTCKCTKLQREIQYLSDLRDRGALTPDDAHKISNALQQLQEYLDRKTKERYEVGVLLSRQLRREIDRGENGQFWVGN
ncbi:LAME_0F17106g1_1 [Lachancea meyersii CBS 8951]|uniref:LAME_0F17106g1_1 n=1 Tax=Lachancea meyersii CBS 8951 TaxID=1266667 RepID=A0A1G4JZQ2_9SACH|nr:LAME_0F17106g1_1 [Lachancea meyersii CBS 8951]